MFEFTFEPSLSKPDFYKELLKTLEALVSGQQDVVRYMQISLLCKNLFQIKI